MTHFDENFFKGKTVLITGPTGFKGSWLTRILLNCGANIIGYSLPPPTMPNIFSLCDLKDNIRHIIGDIRDYDSLYKIFLESKPEIVIHLAAQPLVRESYRNPLYTYETNVMGTVNVLECVRQTETVRSFLNVTTDKVYKNNEWVWGYRENEPLDGFDPYSNSKSCSELVTHSYKNSYFDHLSIGVSTARAGNVIGGGDFSEDRIIPDCIRALVEDRPIVVRNPYSIRPYQHVLEPLSAYLMIVQNQFTNPSSYSGYYNVGPDESDCVTTGQLVDLFCTKWGGDAEWVTNKESDAPHEASFLKLDCSKLKATFGWKPKWHIDEAVEKVCDWTKVWLQGGDVSKIMDKQIEEFLE